MPGYGVQKRPMKISRVSDASPCCAVVKASSWPPHLTPLPLEPPALLEASLPSAPADWPAPPPLDAASDDEPAAAASAIVEGLNFTLTPVYLW